MGLWSECSLSACDVALNNFLQSVVKGVGEYVGGSQAGDLADEREAKEKAAKDKEKKEKEDKTSKGDAKEKGSTKDSKAKDTKAKRARATSASVPEPRATVEEVAACVPIITGLVRISFHPYCNSSMLTFCLLSTALRRHGRELFR